MSSSEERLIKNIKTYEPNWLKAFKDAQELPVLKFSDQQMNEITATVIAEAHNGRLSLEDQKAIGWVYYNILANNRYETAMGRSSAYGGKSGWYMGVLNKLGDKRYADKEIPSGQRKWMRTKSGDIAKTVGEWGDAEADRMDSAAIILKEELSNAFKNTSANPNPKYENQGGAIDLNKGTHKGFEWYKVRAYWWIQKEGLVPNNYENTFVKELVEEGRDRTYIFNYEAILKYFKENPDKLGERIPKINKKTGAKD